MNQSLVSDPTSAAFIPRREDALLLGLPGAGKNHLAQVIGHAVIGQAYQAICRGTHNLLDQIAEASVDGTRKEHMRLLASVALLIIDDRLCASWRPQRQKNSWRW
jgi:DNA replication protein DnaC